MSVDVSVPKQLETESRRLESKHILVHFGSVYGVHGTRSCSKSAKRVRTSPNKGISVHHAVGHVLPTSRARATTLFGRPTSRTGTTGFAIFLEGVGRGSKFQSSYLSRTDRYMHT